MKKSTKITYIWHRVLMAIVFIIGALGTILNKDESIKAEYLFISVQSGMFLIVSFLPNFLKKLDIDIPDFLYIIFIFFCLAHFFCGEILGFFVKIKWWDSALHTFSGMLIALLSFSLINLLNKNSENFKLNIGFATLFAFSLTVAIGVIWEIIEFSSDLWFGSNMQRAYVSTMNGRGEPLLGQAALADTMKDLILDALGAAVVCIICIIAVRKKKIKVEDLSLIKKKKNDNDEKVNKPEEQIEEKTSKKEKKTKSKKTKQEKNLNSQAKGQLEDFQTQNTEKTETENSEVQETKELKKEPVEKESAKVLETQTDDKKE